MNSLIKTLTTLALNLVVSVPLHAAVVEHKDLRFKVSAENLVKGDIQYAYKILSPRKIADSYPEVYDLDSLSFLQESNVQIVLSKVTYIVDKPSGFFDHEHIADEKFVAHLMGEQKITKTGVNSFRVTVPGPEKQSYVMNSYFDSDDMSTLPNSRIIKAVTASKKLDVISQGASSTVFQEFTKFTRLSPGAVQVTSYIPLKENKTLVISYKVTAVQKDQAIDKRWKSNIVEEAKAVKALIENYK